MEEIMIRTAEPGDLKRLLEIYNYEVENGVATFDLHPRTMEERMKWFRAHNIANHPLLVAVAARPETGGTVAAETETGGTVAAGTETGGTAAAGTETGGTVAGYASLSEYREKEAYAATVELSIYVAVEFRGRGIARTLMEAILAEARRRDDIHTIISVITEGNDVSVHLHEEFGFEHCGTMREVGEKFGRRLGIVNMQLMV